MNIDFAQINWLAIVVCFVVGQVFLTLWFTVLFGEPWAKAYDPKKTKSEHTKETPGYTYGIGALCTLLLTLGIAFLQNALNVQGISSGVSLGLFVSLMIVATTMLPGYAFLKKLNGAAIALGSQVVLIIILSIILSAWK